MLDHASWMLTLAHYTNKLPGTEPSLTNKQIKNVFSTALATTVYPIGTTSCQQDIIKFMSNKKLFADTQNLDHALHKKKHNNLKDNSS
jgi:hypothetical protein